MVKKFLNIFIIFATIFVISGCSRNLDANTYTSDSNLNIVLEGKLLAKRSIIIKENERLSDNTIGALAGGAVSGLATARGTDNSVLIVGGAIVGGITGAVLQSALGTTKGIEYIVQVDRSTLKDNYYEGSKLVRNALAAIRATGIITIVQARENKNNPVINEGQKVMIILSEKRTRLIPAAY